jgi:hypothetical protein
MSTSESVWLTDLYYVRQFEEILLRQIMKNRIKCFWLEPAGKIHRSFRRYSRNEQVKCNSKYAYHNAHIFLDELPDTNPTGVINADIDVEPFAGDERWPSHCVCGYEFQPDDHYQIFVDRIYKRTDTGEEMTLQSAPAGAMYDAWWYPDAWKGEDGIALIVKMPGGGSWHVESRASNCTLPNDNKHRCWVRKGNPQRPETLTVGKDGLTCSAGAGSIVMNKWHGFLRNGYLEEC